MPTLTRWYLKTALIYLVASLVVGVMLAARSIWSLPALFSGFGPVYFHLFMVGWVAQLIFGVIYWLFPRYSQELHRGRSWLGWLTFSLLNTGLLLRVVAEPMNALQSGPAWDWLLALSAFLQWVAGLAFVYNTWPRVHGGPRRQAKER